MKTYYRFLHPSKDVQKISSSGGAFTLISDKVIEHGGSIYGCILDADMRAKHIRALDKETRNLMCGSKYIQSDISSVFSEVKGDLESGMYVLFSGTPCQNYAVMKYLKQSNTNLDKMIMLEIICHGVGSIKFFYDYLNCLEEKYNGHTISVNFRAKHHKGQKQDMAVKFDNGKTYHASSTKYDWFYSVYLKDLILRPSCYKCPYAKQDRYADISIADHWGYKDDEAYSMVLSNTPKGDFLLKEIKLEELKEIPSSEVKQPHMHHPCLMPLNREQFWDIYLKQGYLSAQKWVGNNTIKGKLKDTAAKIAYALGIARILKKIYR